MKKLTHKALLLKEVLSDPTIGRAFIGMLVVVLLCLVEPVAVYLIGAYSDSPCDHFLYASAHSGFFDACSGPHVR